MSVLGHQCKIQRGKEIFSTNGAGILESLVYVSVCVCVCVCVSVCVCLLSCVQLFATLWTVAQDLENISEIGHKKHTLEKKEINKFNFIKI